MNHVDEIDDLVAIRNVLISVSNKDKLEELADGLLRFPDVKIFSTGGTYRALESILGVAAGDRLVPVSSYTGQPEMQGGLVKTLDYKIYLGLLSEPFNDNHRADCQAAEAQLIDMVVVNLYPFSEVVKREESDAEDARSNIDIGGPTMLRAAAKNYLRVAAVCDPEDYKAVCGELKQTQGRVSFRTRASLAGKVFAHTASYDQAIADHFLALSEARTRAPYRVHQPG